MKRAPELDEQGQASLQLLHENNLTAQKKRYNIGVATAVQIEGALSSPFKNPRSGTAHEMANMINSSRSTQIKKGLGDGKLQRDNDRKLPGKLRKVVQAGTPHAQRYNLRSKPDDGPTSQQRTAKYDARLDTYDIDSSPEYTLSPDARSNPSREDGEEPADKSHQKHKNTERKSKRTAAKRTGLSSSGRTKQVRNTDFTSKKTQSLDLSLTGAGDTDHQTSEEGKDESRHNSTFPIAGENSAKDSSRASKKLYGRSRKERNENSLTLRQSKADIINGFSHLSRNRRLGSLKTGQGEDGAYGESSHEDRIINVHKDNKVQNSTRHGNIKIDLASHKKRTGRQADAALGRDMLRSSNERELERNGTVQRGRNRQIPEDQIPTSDHESAQSTEAFRLEDMFGHGNELNTIFANALELSNYDSDTESNATSDEPQSSLLDSFEDKYSKLRAFVKQHSFDNRIRHSEYDVVVNNLCSEISDSLQFLVEDLLKSNVTKNTIHKAYAKVMPSMTFVFQDLLRFFGLLDSEEEGLYLEGFGLDVVIELAHCIESFHENTASMREDNSSKSKGLASRVDISERIVKSLKNICKAFEEERYELLAAEEIQASSLRREEEVACQERRKARLRERRERAEARRNEWHSLHVARLAAEPDPRRFPHLRLKELASDTDLDANGELFERLELFAPRTQASPAVLQNQFNERSEWTDAELAALLDGLKIFAGPSVFYDIFATYCGPDKPLRSYNVQQITRKAAYLRRMLLQANLTQNRESENWIKSIPIYE